MKKIFLLLTVCLFFMSCGSKQPAILSSSTNPVETSSDYIPFFDVSEHALDASYGLSEKNPVKVGGFDTQEGVVNQRRYLSSLAGPNGEEVSFHRRGSCCPYKSDKGFDGTAFLDVYVVSYEGLKEPILIYISFYDYEKLYIPKGFTKVR